jgi:hypothetical protein
LIPDPDATLRLAYEHLTGEITDARQQLAALTQTLQALPAVGAITLALFAALASLPAYQESGPTALLALGLLPFVGLVVLSVLEFGRNATSGNDIALTDPDDSLAVGEWLHSKIGTRRLELRVLELMIVRKRNRLRVVSILLATQVGYLLVITLAVALLGTTK